jgi:uncharacterized 2Fe-2S/4Fe-4S cluster protein (DUF4445 family)
MTANDDIVADLDLVIDLRAFTNHGVAVGPAVNGGVGADLDVILYDDPPDLRHLQVSPGPMA